MNYVLVQIAKRYLCITACETVGEAAANGTANKGKKQADPNEKKAYSFSSPLIIPVDRMERGKGTKSALSEIEEKYGLKTTAIVTMAEVVEHLYNKEYKGKVIIDDKLKTAIDAYYEQYGVKE